MKKTTILMALAAILGLAVAGTIPALAQEQDEPTQPAVACPYHDDTDMPHVESWMGSQAHDQRMQSTEYSRMHESMEGSPGMTNGTGMMNGTGMNGTSMMGASG